METSLHILPRLSLPKYRQQGFTVIELVLVFVVLAVVAGLLALALDVHRVRAQVSHSLEAAQQAREVLERFFVDTGRAPLAEEELTRHGLAMPSLPEYLSALRLEGGRLELVFGNRASARLVGHTLALSPYVSINGEFIWHCGDAPLPAGLTGLAVPAGPRAPTMVPRQFLPTACRN